MSQRDDLGLSRWSLVRGPTERGLWKYCTAVSEDRTRGHKSRPLGAKKKSGNQLLLGASKGKETLLMPRFYPLGPGFRFLSSRNIYCCSVAQSCLTPCDPMECSTPDFTVSQSLLKLMSIELVMPSNHLVLYHPLSPPALNLSQHQVLFQWVGTDGIR